MNKSRGISRNPFAARQEDSGLGQAPAQRPHCRSQLEPRKGGTALTPNYQQIIPSRLPACTINLYLVWRADCEQPLRSLRGVR